MTVTEASAAPTADVTQAEDTPPEFKKGLSVSAKLMMAFGTCTALTVVMGLVSWLGVNNIGKKLDAITADGMPLISAALDLSRETANLTAEAPKLVAAATEQDRKAVQGRLDGILARVMETVARFKENEAKAEVQLVLGDLAASIAAMNGVVERRNGLRLQIENLNQEADAITAEWLERLVDTKDLTSGGMMLIGEAFLQHIEAAKDLAQAREMLEMGVGVAMARVQPFSHAADAVSAASQQQALVRQLQNAQTLEQLAAVESVFAEVMNNLYIATDGLKEHDETLDFEDLIKRTNDVVSGEKGLLALRKAWIALSTEAKGLIAKQQGLSAKLTDQVGAMAAAAETEIGTRSGEAERTMTLTWKFALLLSVIAIVAAALIAVVYVRGRLVRRLTHLKYIMEELAGGNLEVRVPRDGHDEITAMALTLRVFREAQKEVVKASERRQRDRDEAAKRRQAEMAALADRFDESVGGITSNVAKSAASVRQSAESLTGVANTAVSESNETAKLTEQVGGYMQSVTSATDEMSSSIKEISLQVQQSAETAQEAVNRAKQTDQEISRLSQAAEDIGGVVQAISEIAEQTNLLALNATIEAARAGDAGKGFAVVASEVKSLANQTATATEDIARQVEAMQNTTSTAVASVAEIGEIVARVDNIASAIAAAVEEQATVTGGIARDIGDTSAASDDVSRKIGSVASAAGTTGEEAATLLQASGQLEELSTTLRQEIDRFIGSVREAA